MTQKEIAKLLNVSQPTVSMALNGSERISRELRDAVRKLADRSGYRPNLAGQLLRQGQGEAACGFTPPEAADILRRELSHGRVTDSALCERAVLSRLRVMTEEDWRGYDPGGEGLYHRLYQAARSACTVDRLLSAAKLQFEAGPDQEIAAADAAQHITEFAGPTDDCPENSLAPAMIAQFVIVARIRHHRGNQHPHRRYPHRPRNRLNDRQIRHRRSDQHQNRQITERSQHQEQHQGAALAELFRCEIYNRNRRDAAAGGNQPGDSGEAGSELLVAAAAVIDQQIQAE